MVNRQRGAARTSFAFGGSASQGRDKKNDCLCTVKPVTCTMTDDGDFSREINQTLRNNIFVMSSSTCEATHQLSAVHLPDRFHAEVNNTS